MTVRPPVWPLARSALRAYGKARRPRPVCRPAVRPRGHARASHWLRTGGLAGYDRGHDDLAADSASRLSPYLHFGCLSPTQLAHQAVGGDGAELFLRQLRAGSNFHHQVLAAFPDLPHADYRAGSREWRHDPDGLEAWQPGLTGIPIVDAGMRQLRSEGWMHNRARLLDHHVSHQGSGHRLAPGGATLHGLAG